MRRSLPLTPLCTHDHMPDPTLRPPPNSEPPRRRRRWQSSRAYPDNLTCHEAEVPRLLAVGRPNKESALALTLNVHTVDAHVASLYAKAAAHNRADATAYAFRADFAVSAERIGGASE